MGEGGRREKDAGERGEGGVGLNILGEIDLILIKN